MLGEGPGEGLVITERVVANSAGRTQGFRACWRSYICAL